MTEDDAELLHWYLHAADRWVPYSTGPGAARRISRLMSRITRNQRYRDAALVGCRDLGGEGGGA